MKNKNVFLKINNLQKITLYILSVYLDPDLKEVKNFKAYLFYLNSIPRPWLKRIYSRSLMFQYWSDIEYLLNQFSLGYDFDDSQMKTIKHNLTVENIVSNLNDTKIPTIDKIRIDMNGLFEKHFGVPEPYTIHEGLNMSSFIDFILNKSREYNYESIIRKYYVDKSVFERDLFYYINLDTL